MWENKFVKIKFCKNSFEKKKKGRENWEFVEWRLF